jgi:hypothetical protein
MKRREVEGVGKSGFGSAVKTDTVSRQVWKSILSPGKFREGTMLSGEEEAHHHRQQMEARPWK